MIRASLIALAAAAALTAGASSASAGVDVHIGFPGVGIYNPYYGNPYYSPVYEPVYDEDCHYIKVKKWVWKNGHKHKVFVKKLVCY
jgi:ABC-type sugar transport system substrate-binding protein